MENVIGDAMLKMFKKNSPLSGLAEKESSIISPPRTMGKAKTSFSGLKV
jgi:hypothetical protein